MSNFTKVLLTISAGCNWLVMGWAMRDFAYGDWRGWTIMGLCAVAFLCIMVPAIGTSKSNG